MSILQAKTMQLPDAVSNNAVTIQTIPFTSLTHIKESK